MNIKSFKMVSNVYLHAVIILFFSITSCNTNKNTLTGLKLTKLEKRFNKVDTSPGKRNVSLSVSDNDKWNMRICFPEESTKKNMLVIALHWGGGGKAFEKFSSCLVEPAMSNLNAIIISPDSEYLSWNDPHNEDKILQLVAMAKRFWNVDPSNIIVLGYSNGGIGSWYFADKYPEIFRAAIPIASMYKPVKKIDVPLYVIHGEKDELFKIDEIRSAVDLSIEYGTKIKLITNINYSHYMACDYVEELKKVAMWLKE